jgi:hypothetical protein
VNKKMVEKFPLGTPSEELRLKLLEEEFKLRKKQPTPWTKTKFRPFANFKTKKKKKKEN